MLIIFAMQYINPNENDTNNDNHDNSSTDNENPTNCDDGQH